MQTECDRWKRSPWNATVRCVLVQGSDTHMMEDNMLPRGTSEDRIDVPACHSDRNDATVIELMCLSVTEPFLRVATASTAPHLPERPKVLTPRRGPPLPPTSGRQPTVRVFTEARVVQRSVSDLQRPGRQGTSPTGKPWRPQPRLNARRALLLARRFDSRRTTLVYWPFPNTKCRLKNKGGQYSHLKGSATTGLFASGLSRGGDWHAFGASRLEQQSARVSPHNCRQSQCLNCSGPLSAIRTSRPWSERGKGAAVDFINSAPSLASVRQTSARMRTGLCTQITCSLLARGYGGDFAASLARATADRREPAAHLPSPHTHGPPS
ncbi:hypothetical protein Bbelb_013200 [Branchiostoma belcheri]|nr:hypothetical protein Bbelb_013200 [Branchiostoma belcheri]